MSNAEIQKDNNKQIEKVDDDMPDPENCVFCTDKERLKFVQRILFPFALIMKDGKVKENSMSVQFNFDKNLPNDGNTIEEIKKIDKFNELVKDDMFSRCVKILSKCYDTTEIHEACSKDELERSSLNFGSSSLDSSISFFKSLNASKNENKSNTITSNETHSQEKNVYSVESKTEHIKAVIIDPSCIYVPIRYERKIEDICFGEDNVPYTQRIQDLENFFENIGYYVPLTVSFGSRFNQYINATSSTEGKNYSSNSLQEAYEEIDIDQEKFVKNSIKLAEKYVKLQTAEMQYMNYLEKTTKKQKAKQKAKNKKDKEKITEEKKIEEEQKKENDKKQVEEQKKEENNKSQNKVNEKIKPDEKPEEKPGKSTKDESSPPTKGDVEQKKNTNIKSEKGREKEVVVSESGLKDMGITITLRIENGELVGKLKAENISNTKSGKKDEKDEKQEDENKENEKKENEEKEDGGDDDDEDDDDDDDDDDAYKGNEDGELFGFSMKDLEDLEELGVVRYDRIQTKTGKKTENQQKINKKVETHRSDEKIESMGTATAVKDLKEYRKKLNKARYGVLSYENYEPISEFLNPDLKKRLKDFLKDEWIIQALTDKKINKITLNELDEIMKKNKKRKEEELKVDHNSPSVLSCNNWNICDFNNNGPYDKVGYIFDSLNTNIWSLTENFPISFTIDFGKTYEIQEVAIIQSEEKVKKAESNLIYDMTLLLLENADNGQKKTISQQVYMDSPKSVAKISFTPTNCRYIKIIILSTDGSQKKPISIQRIEVTGKEPSNIKKDVNEEEDPYKKKHEEHKELSLKDGDKDAFIRLHGCNEYRIVYLDDPCKFQCERCERVKKGNKLHNKEPMITCSFCYDGEFPCTYCLSCYHKMEITTKKTIDNILTPIHPHILYLETQNKDWSCKECGNTYTYQLEIPYSCKNCSYFLCIDCYFKNRYII